MKTIEERAREKFPESVVRAHRCEVALRELAADLNAEKEKEVAKLKEKLATLATDYSEVVAGESEMEELTKLRSLLDEVKRYLADVRACEPDHYDADCTCITCTGSRLLTRLSHE